MILKKEDTPTSFHDLCSSIHVVDVVQSNTALLVASLCETHTGKVPDSSIRSW